MFIDKGYLLFIDVFMLVQCAISLSVKYLYCLIDTIFYLQRGIRAKRVRCGALVG